MHPADSIRSPGRALLSLLLVAGLGACHGADTDVEQQNDNEAGAELATRFAEDSAARNAVLTVPFAEVTRRLGSFDFEATSHFVFSRGGGEVEQHDRYGLSRDAEDNFHVVLETPTNELEIYRVDSEVYVRYGKGHVRKKPLRDADADTYGELALASLRDSLQVFDTALAFGAPEAARNAERAALRIPIRLADAGTTSAPIPTTTVPPMLPATPAGSWRGVAKPLDVRGALWIDQATGVITRADVEGRVEIHDRDLRPTQLTLRYHAQMTKIGAVPALKAPKARPEFHRQRPPSDLLGFFRDQLPKPETDEQP